MWSSLFRLLPFEIVNAVKMLGEDITEIRIRRGSYLCVTALKYVNGDAVLINHELGVYVNETMLVRIVDTLTDHSLYAHEETLKEGYITVQGCYRIGVVGAVVCQNGRIERLKRIDSLCIRLWREFEGIADSVYTYLKEGGFTRSLLLFSIPGMGKTTILRDLAVSMTQRQPHLRVSVVDTRSEIVTPRMLHLSHLDVLSGYPKAEGIEIATRVLSPQYILCDEIGASEADSIANTRLFGVPMIATAHASSLDEIKARRDLITIHQSRYFDFYVQIRSLKEHGRACFIITPWEEIFRH